MEVKIGEYVRTKDGNIGKYQGLVNFDKDGKKLYGLRVIENFIPLFVREENITKHSKDIIDLLKARRLCRWF